MHNYIQCTVYVHMYTLPACGGGIGCSSLAVSAAGGGAMVVVEGGGAPCCDDAGADVAPAEVTASGGWYCCVACTPSRSGMEDSWCERDERNTTAVSTC